MAFVFSPKKERILSEDSAKLYEKSRNVTISKVERLYIEAVKDGRITDADYYRKTLKSLYPDWEFKQVLDAPPQE